MEDLTPYANAADLAAYWRTLTAEEEKRANALLPLASNRLRAKALEIDLDIDAKSTASPLYKSLLKSVVLEAVKRAIQTPQDTPPIDSYQQTAGPYSTNYKLTNPGGDLWFKKSELAEIGLTGSQSIFSLTPKTRANIYGEDTEGTI